MRILKIAGWVLGGIVTLLIVGVALVALFFDPNDYKTEIEQLVKDKTGRTFTLSGDLKLSVFPWLAVQVGPATLGNAPGYGDAPMVSIAGARLGIKLRPLLQGQFEIGAVELDSPQIVLVQTADGNNWSDMGGDTDTETPAAEQPSSKLDASIASISIRNGSISYEDRAASTQTSVSDFNLSTGRLQPGQPFDLKSDFKLQRGADMNLDAQLTANITADLDNSKYTLNQPDIKLSVKGASYPQAGMPVNIKATSIVADTERSDYTIQQPEITATLSGESYPKDGMPVNIKATSIVANTGRSDYTIQQPEITTTLSGESYPKEGLPVSIKATSVVTNLDAQTAQIAALVAQAAGATLTGDIKATQIMDAPAVTGSLKLAQLSLRDLAPKFGIELPITADTTTLQKFSMETGLNASKTAVELKPLTLNLDDTTLNGSVGVADLDTMAMRFDLSGDSINLDRYLPPEEPENKQAEASTEPTPIPADSIRDLNLRGKLVFNALTVSKLPMTKLALGVDAANNKLQLNPLQATLYEGKFRGNVTLDASGKQPRINMEQHLEGINFAPLFATLFDSKRIAGRGNANMKLAAVGVDTAAMKKSLNGTLDFSAREGALEGFDLWYEIRRARAVLKQQAIPARTDALRTVFTSLGGSATITDGVVNNPDLIAAMQYMKVTGQGSFNLASDAINYRLNATVNKIPAEDKLAAQEQELSGLTIPVLITGTLADPKVRPDVAGLIKEKAKQRIEEEKEKVIEKAKEKLQDKLKGLFGGG